MDSRPPTPFPFMAIEMEVAEALVDMSEQEVCPICDSLGTYKTHTDHGVNKCPTCEDKVCSECFWGCRYTCPVALPKPQSRKLSNEEIDISPKKEACKYCEALDIRYSNYDTTYKLFGFVCSDCAAAISGF